MLAQKGKLPKDAIVVGNPKVICPIQTHVSGSGQELENPITRMTLKLETQPGIYDRSSGYYDNYNKPRFNPLLFDGEPVAPENVHKLKSKSSLSGIVKLNSVCLSRMGISILTKVLLLMVEQPKRNTLDDTSVLEKLTEELDLKK